MLTTPIIINIICCKLEAEMLHNNYGQFVEVHDGKMCVGIKGTGDRVVVLLTGWASPSPVLEMAPLAEKLKDDYTVITIEYFGYGLSDVTKKGRTIENITEEIHAVIYSLGYKRYTLMAHSMSGVYALYYSNQYPEEIESFVGIDTSVPRQNEYMHTQKLNLRNAYIAITEKNLGILRIVSKISPSLIIDDIKDFKRSQTDTELLLKLYLNKWFNRTVINEHKYSTENFAKAKELKFPEEIPVLFFLASQECEKLEQWYNLHEEVIVDKMRSRIITLEGPHFLHYHYSQEIVDTFKQWIVDIK
jgi:pimeloyl-ACP methyl ester carboxylesterase